MFGRGTHGGCEYKCVYECGSVCVCREEKRWQMKIALSKREGGWRELRGGEVEEEEQIE